MIRKDPIHREKALNITKFIVTFMIIALISFGCSSDGGSSGPTDSDGDGVLDSEDYCPNTPPGNQVNPDGCTLPRFTDKGDGTIQDNETDLIWLKDANAFGSMTWHNAMDAVANLSSGDYGLSDGSLRGDWRLPTKEEWEYFFHQYYRGPPVSNTLGDDQWAEGDAFNSVLKNYYWSSTTTNDINDAWLAYLRGYGQIFTYIKTFKGGSLWPVRSGG